MNRNHHSDERFKEIREMLNAIQQEQKKGMGEVMARLSEVEGRVQEIRDAMFTNGETGKPSLFESGK